MLRLLLCSFELRSSYEACNCSGVPFGKGKSPQTRRNFRFQGAMGWGFLLVMMCFSGEATFSRDVMDMLTFRVGEPLPKIAAWAPRATCIKPRSSSSPASTLLCLRKASKISDGTTSTCPRPGDKLRPPALPCSPVGCQLLLLMEDKLVERHFSTAGQTTSSRTKLFWTLSNSFL